jgi:hypothetical protein
MSEQVSEWRNTTSGHLGVVKHDEEGKKQGVSVPPNGTVLLTEKDRIATANAPKNPANNPFVNGALECIRADADTSSLRPIGDPADKAEEPAEPPEEPKAEETPPQETGAAEPPQGDPSLGKQPIAQEVAAKPKPAPVAVTQEEQKADVQPAPPTPTPPTPLK